MQKYYYSTKRLVVYFTWSNDNLCVAIYRIHDRVLLQTYAIKRPGFTRLDNLTQVSVKRALLKALRNRMNVLLQVELTK